MWIDEDTPGCVYDTIDCCCCGGCGRTEEELFELAELIRRVNCA